MANPMHSGDLIPTDNNPPEQASNEVQFALVIARMIDSVSNNPEQMRQAVYELARHKLQEQFTHADAKDVVRTQQALETAIRGVEEFSKQPIDIPDPPPVPRLGDSRSTLPRNHSAPPPLSPARPRSRMQIEPELVDVMTTGHKAWPLIKRTAGTLAILCGVLLIIQHREKLASFLMYPLKQVRQLALSEQPRSGQDTPTVAPKTSAVKLSPLRPTDYGVYAISNNSLAELQILPGRPSDIRVAISAALKVPSRTLLPNGHPKFIVYRRDPTTNFSDRAEVRVMAKVTREFSVEAAGKKPDDDETWVIRNISFPFRASAMIDSPEMYELHSEDPALELTPGRYALVLKTLVYDFTVEGKIVDPKQCIERIISANGTFYADCKKP